MTDRLSVLIYGSCVSRDSFEYFDQTRFERESYYARHSLISLFHPTSASVIEGADVASRFQRRMLEWDARSMLLTRIYSKVPKPDVILWDLVDERLGVVQLPEGGGFITISNELLDSGLELPEGSRQIPFGTDEHFELWSQALRRFSKTLSEHGLRRRTILLRAPWAELTSTGRPAEGSHGLSPANGNALYERYYDAASAVQHIRTLSMSTVEAAADENHKWGPAPFHYTEDFYRTVARRFATMASTRPSK